MALAFLPNSSQLKILSAIAAATGAILLGQSFAATGKAEEVKKESPSSTAGDSEAAPSEAKLSETAPSEAAPSPMDSSARETILYAKILRLQKELLGGPVRGVTIGPIESGMHPDTGYGSKAFEQSLIEVQRLGANWISLTPFGRIWDLDPSGVDLRFEASFADNRRGIILAVKQAHALGLKVLLVPHIWSEGGGWRGEIDPKSDEGWNRWAKGYQDFAVNWAKVSAEAGVDLFAIGVEMRSFLTTSHAPKASALIDEIRRHYHGPLTYSANWDDVDDTVIWDKLDVVGLNAFYPLAENPQAKLSELRAGAVKIRERLKDSAMRFEKPILFCEFGYTTRPDPALRPWEWPETFSNIPADQQAQAEAYLGLMSGIAEEPYFSGAFVWRFYADPNDMSQETEWGFSPRGKLAELVLREGYARRFGLERSTGIDQAWGSTLENRVGPF